MMEHDGKHRMDEAMVGHDKPRRDAPEAENGISPQGGIPGGYMGSGTPDEIRADIERTRREVSQDAEEVRVGAGRAGVKDVTPDGGTGVSPADQRLEEQLDAALDAAAARLRVVVDKRLGRKTPAKVLRMARRAG